MDVPAGVTSLTYDGNGNMVNDSNWIYLYNEDNRLKTVTTQAGVLKEQYLYGQNGSRKVKLVRLSESLNETTYYVSRNWHHIEYSNGSVEDVLYIRDDPNSLSMGNILAQKDSSGAKTYYHPDHLGSTTIISKEDGSLEESISYKPFGEPRQSSDEVFQFTSQEYSSELGIFDYGARQYNPVLRRFIQPDTLISDCYNPQILNRYSYVVNNPLKYTDPTGNVLITVDFLSLSYTTEYGGGNLDAKTESFGIVLDIDSKPGFAFYSKEGSGESSFDLSLSANVGISEGDTVTDIGGKSYEEQTNLGGLSITEGYDKPPNERLIFPLKDKSQSTSYGVGPGINRIASFSLYETNTHVLVVFSFDSDKQGGTEK